VETGRRDEATRILKELEDQSRTDVRAWIPIALAADALGDVDRAIAALEAAFAARAPFVAGLALEGWIVLRNTRPTHQFRALLDRIGVKSHDVARQRELLLEFARDLQPG
jgi:predicted Zn-dependent protease